MNIRTVLPWGRIVRFGVVGVINTATYYVLFRLFNLFLVYLVAHLVAFVLAMIGSYFLNCYFTFRTKPSWRTFLLFPLTTVSNLVIQTVGLYALVEWVGMNEDIAPLVAALVAIPITFVATQLLMTGRRKPTEVAETLVPEREPQP